MFRIVVSVREKRSTHSQFENASIGCDLEASGLELSSPDDVVRKAREMFQMARSAVQGELLHAVPERPAANANGHRHENGHRNGNGRSYGRPQPEPSPKQRVLLQRLATERGLTAEQVGEVARRELGKPVPQLDRHEMSLLLEHLMEREARP